MSTKQNLQLLAAVFISIFSLGCAIGSDSGNQGSTVQQVRNVASFDGIDAGGAFRIFVTQGENQTVMVEAQEQYIDDIETTVKSGTLIISTRRNLKDPGIMNVYITLKELRKLEISGACKLTSENRFQLSDIDIECSGAAMITFALSANQIDLDCSGAGQIELLGSAESVKLELSGAASLDASELEIIALVADISGASNASVHVTGDLSAEVSGAGSLKYRGEPELKKTEVSGAGRIKKL